MQISLTYDIFTAVKIHIQVFCIVTPSSDVVGYQHLEGPSCLHIQGEVSRWRQHCPPKCWYPTSLHGIRDQKTMTCNVTIFSVLKRNCVLLNETVILELKLKAGQDFMHKTQYLFKTLYTQNTNSMEQDPSCEARSLR
jgi:hypothetical protein